MKKLFFNNFSITCAYYLFSQRFLYLLKPKSNYLKWELIFYSRQILNWIALSFFKKRAFNVSSEAEKRGANKFLSNTRIWRLEVSSALSFLLRVSFLPVVSIFSPFSACFFFKLISTFFSVEHFFFSQIFHKIHQRTTVLESFLFCRVAR